MGACMPLPQQACNYLAHEPKLPSPQIDLAGSLYKPRSEGRIYGSGEGKGR